MTPRERWLAALWPIVRANLPAPPAEVVEIGCGPLGGFVPMLLAAGYGAIGIDPHAPAEKSYLRSEFETAELPERVDAVVACTSLHHVADPAFVVDRIGQALAGDGVVVVVEWDWTEFDEATARWCFERLGSDDENGWLRRRRDGWAESGKGWDAYFREWADTAELHSARALVRLLDERFDRTYLAHGPFAFPELAGTSEADEEDAIRRGTIRATRIDYVATAASR